MNNKFDVLLAIDSSVHPTIKTIHAATGFSISSINRCIRTLREDYMVDIRFEKNPLLTVPGFYRIEGWGVFDENKIKIHFSGKLKTSEE